MSSSHRHSRRARFFINNLPDYSDATLAVEAAEGTGYQLGPSPISDQTITTLEPVISDSGKCSDERESDRLLISGTKISRPTEVSTDSVNTNNMNNPSSASDNSGVFDSAPNATTTDVDKPLVVGQPSPEAIVDHHLIKKRLAHLINLIVEKQKCSNDADCCDGGLYVGISGISFMFYYLSSSTNEHLFSPEERELFNQQALRFLGPTLEYASSLEKSDRLSSVAYLLGFAGTFAVSALVHHSVGDTSKRDFYINKYEQIASKCLPLHYLTKGSDELLVGRAGYICGANLLNKCLGKKVIPDGLLLALALASIKSGREYSQRKGLKNICPLMYVYYGNEYLGAAHGLAGILQALLVVPGILNGHLDLERDIKKSIDYLLSIQTESGNFPCALDELADPTKNITIRPEENELVHWCHGAPGVIWLMARAYLIWKEEKYLDCCIKCGDLVWSKGLLRKGPGICHGVAGNALVFLLLHRLTGQPKYLHRANQFQEFLFTEDFRSGSRIPDSPYSMFEGWAGTICFLTDLLQPERSQFPLYFNPFDDDITSLYSAVEPKI